jgi:transcription termination factor NusB
MAPKTKTTTRGDHDAKVKDWSKRLYAAVLSKTDYSKDHTGILEEFQKLRDEARDLDITKVSMINHAAPIYDHVASQGYKDHVHFEPLRKAVSNFCAKRPVNDWKGPPDQHSRTPSPLIPPSSIKPKAKFVTMVASGPSGLKKKAAEPIRIELDDESEKESAKPRKPTADESKSLPAMDGMELNPTKCSLCDSRSHGCHVNPKATKAAAACFECNHWRLKCSLASNRGKKGEDEEDAAASKEQAPKRRRKPNQVPAGQSGQFSSKLTYIFANVIQRQLIFNNSFTTDTLAPEVLKRMESFESGSSVLLEKLDEMAQAVDRQSSEIRSAKEWFKGRFQLLSENHDEKMLKVMKGIKDNAAKMDAILKLTPADHRRSQSPLSLAPPIPQRSTPTATASVVPDSERPVGELSNKRLADDEPIEPENKRRKLQEKA